MTNHPLIGIVFGIILESSHWTKVRWDFNEDTCSRAWQFSTIGILIASGLIYLEGDAYNALPDLLTWLPPLLLPMQFIQSYGLADSLPLNTFSFLARQRRRRNLRLGLPEATIYINFGNVYFVTAMVASTLGSHASSLLFLPGLIILTGWRLLSSSRSRPLALVVALAVAGGLAVAGQRGLQTLENWLAKPGVSRNPFDPYSANTMIGKLGAIQQSPDILWRIRTEKSQVPPRLLRTGNYNVYRAGTWANQPASVSEFQDLDTRLSDRIPHYILARDSSEQEQVRAVSQSVPRFRIRGGAFAETPLPLPGDASSLRDFELDGIEWNSFGTVRMFPKESIIEGMVLWKGQGNTEIRPLLVEDLRVPQYEKKALAALAEELRLNDLPTLEAKLAAIQTWFHRNFRYSRNLSIRSSPHASKQTAMSQFLNLVRSGHCEYFASATTLLLRHAGIPARYATGYAVVERDMKRNEFVIRGTHGHAWVRVWNEKQAAWMDFDTTPGNWTEILNPSSSAQPFTDALQRVREDFFIWRNRPKNRVAATAIMIAVGTGVLLFVFKRLWKSKRQIAEEKIRGRCFGPLILTSLHELETHAERHLGSRAPGEPFGGWLGKLRLTSLSETEALNEAIEIYQRLRFDPEPSSLGDNARLAELTQQLKISIKRK
jgi:hypothetical protein